VLNIAWIKVRDSVSSNFAERACVRTDHWTVLTHRFKNGETETFVERGKDQGRGVAIIRCQRAIVSGHEPNFLRHVQSRDQICFLCGKIAITEGDDVEFVFQEGRGGERLQKPGKILVSLPDSDMEQIAARITSEVAGRNCRQ